VSGTTRGASNKLEVEAELEPGPPLQQGLPDDESSQLLREPTPFGIDDELGSRKQSPLRMLPPDERLDTAYLVCEEVCLEL
jgi:hypothetical protein